MGGVTWCRVSNMSLSAALTVGVFFFATSGAAEPVVVTAFDQPLLFVYGEWEGKVAVADGRLPIRGVNGKGGGGCVWLQDLTPHADRLPAFVLRVLPENRATGISFLLEDRAKNLARWDFTLPAPGEAPNDAPVTLLPKNGGSLAEPDSLTKPGKLDLANITNWQIIGDWSDKSVEVIIERIVLLSEEDDPRIAEVLAARQARLEAERKKIEEELAAARAAVRHTPESPWIERSYLVAPDVLAISIRAREVIPGRIEPYIPQPGDEVRPKDHRADLYRNGVFVAKVVGPKLDTLVFDDQIRGDALLEILADRADTWAISSPDDPNYAAPTAPARVSRKSKPVNWQHGGWGRDSFAMRHIVYLHLPHPLVEGARYMLDCSRINLRETAYSFVNRPRETWSEAVHCCQVGFRPDDPLKRGFLSVWLGTGGAQSYSDGLGFAVLDDATGKEVYRGKVEVSRRASEPEYMWVKEPRNWNYTDVLRMDFSELTRPGTYRLYVDGIGCSHPFRIAEDVWQKAFLIQMQGLLNQRSGIELGPPYTAFRKPRDFHPEDGVQVFQSTYSILDGECEFAVAKYGTDQLVPEGWGGWHDAGDWNPRRMTHLRNNVDLLLELAAMFPDYFARLSWPLPDQQPVPSLLREIMFEVDCFRRLQLPNGACRHGMETEGDPRDGEVSWKQTMPVYVYAPDPWSSFIYASVAARLAWVTQRYDESLAATYRESAARAMEWAEAEWQRIREEPKVKERWEIPDDRNLAAIELYRLTGDKRWLDIFMQDTVLKNEKPELFAWGHHVQAHAAFTYAALPDNMADPVLKARAKAGLLELAERALAYADGNAWGLTTSDKGRPLFLFFYSVPQAVDLVRAHFLTGDPKYLRGILQACLFPGGANPMNATFTVGVGADWPRNPLHVDSRITGQPAPLGLTVYGPCDFLNWQGDFFTWPMNLLLSQVNTPGPYGWPVPEAFYDIWIYVAQDEYTVEGFGQNAYVWGYLAARG
ncbi:MAG: glycoside hydrolase family 9 protein [Armatimonadetes bacterium]|nr:glycoside hydrolase family 9 protein [Armatimonadota bacterium]